MKQEFTNEHIYYYKNEKRKEVIMEKLRSYGYRITRQRQVLLDIILGQDCTSCMECDRENACVIEFEDNTFCQL